MRFEIGSSAESPIYLFDEHLWGKGIRHGFSTAKLGATPEAILGPKLGASRSFSMNQVHGAGVIDLRAVEDIPVDVEGDAIIVNLNRFPQTMYYVKSADCVPLICFYKGEAALIHAGWRGLGKGVIEQALKALLREAIPSATDEVKILIGPSAQHCCYEVGDDVLNALGDRGAFYFSDTPSVKPKLGMGESAEKVAMRSLTGIGWNNYKIDRSEICTICDQRFNSYRRQGPNCGRNISFVLSA